MGYSTKSLLFDGSTQYGTAGNVLGYEYNQAFSLSAWVKTTDTNASLMSKWQSGAPAGYLFQLNSASLLFGMVNVWSTDGFWVTAPCSPSDGSWHHVAVTYSGSGDSSGVQFYLDSVLLTKNAPSFDNLVSSVVNTVEFRLARDVSGADAPFAGAMDEVAVYNKELSPTEAIWLYNFGNPRDLKGTGAPSNLVGWWRCGESVSGATMPDANASKYSPLTTSIELNNGTTDEYVNFGLNAAYSFAMADAMSMGVWVKTTNASARTLICKSKIDSTHPGYQMAHDSSGRLYFFRMTTGTTGYIWKTTTVPRDGNWHFIVMTQAAGGSFGGSYSNIYVDGVKQTSLGSGGDPYSPWNGDSTGRLQVGGRLSGTTLYNPHIGRLLHSFMLSRELSGAEVLSLWNSGVPADLDSIVNPADIVHWCALGDGDALGSGGMIDLSPIGNDGEYVNGDSGDFVADVPLGGYPITLVNSPTVQDDAPSKLDNAVTSDLVYREENVPQLGPIYDAVVGTSNSRFITYLMRGLNAGNNYIHWQVTGSPDVQATRAPETIPDLSTVTIVSKWIS